ncbi:hypothetical protein JXA56_00195 [Candidatus Micrarchaeota archaeon]|nr:hypothetical protein [Candidatus Micrarchaeota archaeon]
MAAKPKEQPSYQPRTSKVSGLALRPAQLNKFKDVLEDGELANLLNALFHGSRELVFFSDCTGRFLHANNRTMEALGYSIDELRRTDLQSLLPIEHMMSFMHDLADLVHRTDPDNPRRFIVRSKSMEKLLIEATPIILVRDNNPEAILWHAQLLQNLDGNDECRQKERELEAVAEASSRAAHDIKNLLTCPNSVLEMLKNIDLENPSPKQLSIIRKNIDGAIESVQKVIRLTADMMLLARPKNAQFQSVELKSFMAYLVMRVSALKPQNIEVDYDFDCSDCFVHCDRQMLDRGITNVFLNAIEAMPCGGKLTVTTRKAEDNLIILIRDTGCGISKADLPKIFDPYVTTKKEGTGLGLAIAKKAIKDCDGTIAVDSCCGAGTTFKITVPVTPKAL